MIFFLLYVFWDQTIKSIVMHSLGQLLFDCNLTRWKIWFPHCVNVILFYVSARKLQVSIRFFFSIHESKFLHGFNLHIPSGYLLSTNGFRNGNLMKLEVSAWFQPTYTSWIYVYLWFPQWKLKWNFLIISTHLNRLGIYSSTYI